MTLLEQCYLEIWGVDRNRLGWNRCCEGWVCDHRAWRQPLDLTAELSSTAHENTQTHAQAPCMGEKLSLVHTAC